MNKRSFLWQMSMCKPQQIRSGQGAGIKEGCVCVGLRGEDGTMWRGRKEHFCHLNSPVDDISVVKKKFAMFGEVHCYKHTHTNNVMSDIVGGTERHAVLGAVAVAGSRDWIAQTQCRSSLRRFLGGLTRVFNHTQPVSYQLRRNPLSDVGIM